MKSLIRQWLLWSVILLAALWLLLPVAGLIAIGYLPITLAVTFVIVLVARIALD